MKKEARLSVYASETHRLHHELRTASHLVTWDKDPAHSDELDRLASMIESGGRCALAAAVRSLQIAEGLRSLARVAEEEAKL